MFTRFPVAAHDQPLIPQHLKFGAILDWRAYLFRQANEFVDDVLGKVVILHSESNT